MHFFCEKIFIFYKISGHFHANAPKSQNLFIKRTAEVYVFQAAPLRQAPAKRPRIRLYIIRKETDQKSQPPIGIPIGGFKNIKRNIHFFAMLFSGVITLPTPSIILTAFSL